MRLRICSGVIFCFYLAACAAGLGTTTRWEKLSESNNSHVSPFLSLFFFDNTTGLAVTTSSLEKTYDSGKSWKSLISGGDQSFQTLVFTDPTQGFVGGLEKQGNVYVPMILRTEDRGNNWHPTVINLPPVTTAIKPQIQSISFCNQQDGWAAGANLIVHTRNGGRTWETQRFGKQEGLFGIACIDGSRAVAVGQQGLVLSTTDRGKSWDERVSGSGDLLRVRFFANEGWILGGTLGRSILLRSHDSGLTWEDESVGLRETLFDIYVNGNQGWLVGANGTILVTQDGGETWKQQQSPTLNDLASLFFLSPHEGWAAGDKRTLLVLRDP